MSGIWIGKELHMRKEGTAISEEPSTKNRNDNTRTERHVDFIDDNRVDVNFEGKIFQRTRRHLSCLLRILYNFNALSTRKAGVFPQRHHPR